MKIFERKSRGHYSPAVLSNGTLYISGQLGDDLETGVMPASPEEQARNCLLKIEALLEQAGLTKENIVMTRAYTAKSDFWGPVNAEYIRFFGDHKPARLVVPVGFDADILVEIEAMAEVPQG